MSNCKAPADMRRKGDEKIPTPAIKGVFNVDENNEALNPTTSNLFHRLVAWLLFASKHAQSDI